MKKVRCLIVLAIVVALCSCSISGVPEVIKTEGELLSHLGVKGVSEIYDLEVQQESTEEYDCTNICFKVREDYASFLEANYDEPEDGSDWVGKFEPDEVSKNIFESRIKDISFDDVLNCGTIFKRYSVRLKGDIGKSETSLSTDWYSIIDDNDGEYLLIIASVPQLLDVQIKTEELAEENIAKKEINSIDQILRLLGFNEGFDVYDVRYKHSFNDNNGSTFVCFKADMDLTEFVKKHKNYSEDYLEWCDELQAETDGILYNNLQNKLPENERIPFEYVVKCGTLFSSYTIKVTENQEVVTTNNTEWYLIDDGQKQYLWVGNIIPEMINIDFDEAKNIDNN